MLTRNTIASIGSAALLLGSALLSFGIQAGSSAAPDENQPQLTMNDARIVQAKFSEARAAMDKALLLRDAAPAANLRALEAAMEEMDEALLRMADRAAASGPAISVNQARTLARDWYDSGLKIVNPPRGGVTELPLTTVVLSKGSAAAAALDKVVQQMFSRAARVSPQPTQLTLQPANLPVQRYDAI
jgi:hypothetical protein